MKRIQRIISGCLTVCMIFSMLPMQAFANEIEPAMETIATEVATKEAVEENAVPTETVTGQMAETAAPIVETVESQFSAAAMNVATTVSGTCGENLTWEFDSESATLTISGFGEMESYDGILSETDNYSPWHDIGIKIKHIVIEEGVTTLGDYALDNCSLLEDIYIPASIKELNFTTQIPWSSKLNKFIVSENNAHYSSDEYGFLYSKDKKTLIGCPTAYSGAYRIADGTIEIGERAFDCCSYVSEVYLPNSIKRIGESAFEGCFSLREIILPEGLEEIGQEAFLGCEGLQEMVIPSTVSVIDFFVFVGCENLKSVKFVGNAPSTSDAAFYEFSTTAYYPSNNPTWTEEKRASFDGTIEWIPYDDMQDHVHSYEAAATPPSCIEQGYTTYSCDCGHSYVSDYVDETGHVFGQWYEVKAPTAESEGIEQRDCANCDYCETRETNTRGSIGDNLMWILRDGVLMISGTGSMETSKENVPWSNVRDQIVHVVIQEGISSIGSNAFANCSNLTDVAIPQSVTEINNSAFSDCSSLTTISIPETISHIGDQCFLRCEKLEHVALPDGISEIGGRAFAQCENLTSISLPSNLITLGESVFTNCTNLEEVRLPENIATIPLGTFWQCTKLYAVYIPAGVTDIGDYAFHACLALDDIYFGGTEEQWKAITVGEPNEALELATIHFNSKESDVHQHSYSSTVYEPTCTEQGYTAYVCHCGSTYKQDYVSSTGHDYDSGIVTTQPGCTTDGVRTYTCRNDTTHTYTESVSRIGHDYDDGVVTVPAGCETTGIRTYTCHNDAAHTYTETIRPTGHTMGQWYEVKAPTEDAEGEERCDCENCDYYETKSKPRITNIIDSGVCGKEAIWTLDEFGVLCISGTGEMDNYDHEESYEAPWFAYTDTITEVIITDGITTIGTEAFWNCSNLASIEIPNTVYHIGGSTFVNCSSLASIDLPDAATQLGASMFFYCSSLTSIEIPEGVREIPFQAFCGCSKLTSIDLPNTLVKIDDLAFAHCNFTSIDIPDSVTSIGEDAFDSCSSLTQIDIPDSIIEIKQGAFNYCSSLTSINIPNSITTIENYVFSGCSSLTSISIPDGVTSIGQHAFDSCSELTSIYLPNSITFIGEYAFARCNKISCIDLPDGITFIGERTFYNCSSLSSIDIPDTVTYFENYAFSGCSNLTSIHIPETVSSIGDGVFEECCSLNSIDLPDGITFIGERAFDGCSSLTSITIPEGVTSISDYTFHGCSSLASITIPDGVTGIGDCTFYGCSSLTSITIPDSVTSIGIQAFCYCSSLISITIPNGVTSINNGTFSGCSSLTSITIPDSVTSIGGGTFANCENLTSITIPVGVTSIEVNTFVGCRSLTNITIPDSVTSIGICAFSGCRSLISIAIPSGVTSIGWSAFSNCRSLTSIVIPSGVTNIEGESFAYCTNIPSITIPESVTSIGDGAFRNMYSLTSITIPDSVTSIGDTSFAQCNKLTDVFYSGSESEWSSIGFGSGNELLLNATIHYNSPSPDNSETRNDSVRYFHSWDKENQIAYFDTDPEEDVFNNGCQVTEETDTSFLADVDSLVGAYVLVESEVRTDGMLLPDTLISMKPVDVRIGKVTAADINFIVIDGVTYTTPTGLMFADTYVGETVRYFLYNGVLIDLVECADTYSLAVLYLTRYVDKEGDHGVYFGILEQTRLQITDRTDMSFKEDLDSLLNQYVLVEYNATEDTFYEVLSITPVQSNVGTVQSLDATTVTIDGKTFLTDDNANLTALRQNGFVLYHTQGEKIVGAESLHSIMVNLLGWDSQSRELKLESDNAGKADYFLSDLADQKTLDFLNGLKHDGVFDIVDALITVDRQGFVYQVEEYTPSEEDPPETPTEKPSEDVPEFNNPKYEIDAAELEKLKVQFKEYINEIEKLYHDPQSADANTFVNALLNVINENIEISPEMVKEETIKKIAADMKLADAGSKSKFVSVSSTKDYDPDPVYEALAQIFYEQVGNKFPDVSKIDLRKMAVTSFLNDAIQNITKYEAEYFKNGKKIKIHLTDFLGENLGHIYYNGVPFIICATEDMCKDALQDCLLQMDAQAKKLINEAVEDMAKSIFGTTLSSMAKDCFEQYAKNFGTKFDMKFQTILEKCGLGNLPNVLDKLSSFLNTAKKIEQIINGNDIKQTLKNIQDFEIEEVKFNDKVVEKCYKKLKSLVKEAQKAATEYLTGIESENKKAKMTLTMNCPIEIAVYSADRTHQIGFVGEDDCWYDDTLIIEKMGKVKRFHLLTEEIPLFIITATDAGTMSCCLEENNEGSDQASRMLFYDIPLTTGKIFELQPMRDLQSNSASVVISSGDETFSADQLITTEERTSVTITCDKVPEESGTVYGTGIYAKGDVAKLYAEPKDGYSFVGWYDGNEILNDSLVYEFLARNDKNITPRFVKINLVNIRITNKPGGTAMGDTTVEIGTTVTATALADEGYDFAGWYCNGELVSMSILYNFVAERDIALEARFMPHSHVLALREFQWEKDFSCYGIFNCKTCSYETHIACTVTSATVPETGSDPEEIIYTAELHHNDVTYFDNKVVTIPASDHTTHIPDTSWHSDKTNHWHTCTGCESLLDLEPHSAETISGKAATCMEPGLTEGSKCSVCGTVTVAQKTIPAKGHSYDDYVDGTCNVCGVNRENVEIRQVTHMFRMYNPNTGEHFYTGSEVERQNLVDVGWQYEGVGFTFPANTGAPVYRLFEPATGEHLYTMDEAEKAKLEAEGWNYEGIAFNSAYDTEAVQHRLHNPNATVGAYHFTFSLEEKQNLINAGWEYQGIGWYSCWK